MWDVGFGAGADDDLMVWSLQAFRLQSLKEATTTDGFLAALEVLIATPDADKAAVVQAALKCKREHKVCKEPPPPE